MSLMQFHHLIQRNENESNKHKSKRDKQIVTVTRSVKQMILILILPTKMKKKKILSPNTVNQTSATSANHSPPVYPSTNKSCTKARPNPNSAPIAWQAERSNVKKWQRAPSKKSTWPPLHCGAGVWKSWNDCERKVGRRRREN